MEKNNVTLTAFMNTLSKHMTYINSFKPHYNPINQVLLLSSFCESVIMSHRKVKELV